LRFIVNHEDLIHRHRGDKPREDKRIAESRIRGRELYSLKLDFWVNAEPIMTALISFILTISYVFVYIVVLAN